MTANANMAWWTQYASGKDSFALHRRCAPIDSVDEWGTAHVTLQHAHDSNTPPEDEGKRLCLPKGIWSAER